MLRITTVLLLVASLITPVTKAADSVGAAQPTVLITGGNRGLGLEFARQFDAAGWRVIATARNPVAAADLHSLAAGQNDFLIEQLDVTDSGQIAELAAKYADQPIDLLLLNAAKGPDRKTVMALLKGQEFDSAAAYFETNAIGPMRIAQAFMQHVEKSQRKLVVAISSDSGSIVEGAQLPILYHYKASKAAMNMYFYTLSHETRKKGVTVAMIHPGIVATNENTAQLPNAIPVEDSVRQVIEVIDSLTIEDNGRFLNYLGRDMQW